MEIVRRDTALRTRLRHLVAADGHSLHVALARTRRRGSRRTGEQSHNSSPRRWRFRTSMLDVVALFISGWKDSNISESGSQ